MVSDIVDNESDVRVNRKMELVTVPKQSGGNSMIGISYLTGKQADIIRERIKEFALNKRYDGAFWEETLYEKDRMIVQARVVHATNVVEINTYVTDLPSFMSLAFLYNPADFLSIPMQ